MEPKPIFHMTPASRWWPEEFLHVDSPPTEMWMVGDEALLAKKPRVAIVGTRSPTPYGEAQAQRFASRLATAGMSIVSGLARGIDRIAHEAALAAGGATIAVLGSGVDCPWPRGPLTDRMRAEGLLVSEFPPGVTPRRHHFPLRNRLIAGLSIGVIVVEVAYASGSLITARWAVDQGKTVMAIPGRVDHPMARGCHRLLREGAALVESPEDVLTELALDGVLPPEAAPDSDPGSDRLLAALRGETLNADELCARLGLTTGEVLAELIGQEIAGRIVRSPGGLYRLTENA